MCSFVDNIIPTEKDLSIFFSDLFPLVIIKFIERGLGLHFVRNFEKHFLIVLFQVRSGLLHFHKK